MLPFDPFPGSERIPFLHDQCSALRTKYSLPAYFRHNPHSNDGGRPALPDGLLEDFREIYEKTVALIKQAFPLSVSTSPTFLHRSYVGSSEYSVSTYTEHSFDRWICEQIRPTDHGGWPGAQYALETSPAGEVLRRVKGLTEAYRVCSEQEPILAATAAKAAEAARKRALSKRVPGSNSPRGLAAWKFAQSLSVTELKDKIEDLRIARLPYLDRKSCALAVRATGVPTRYLPATNDIETLQELLVRNILMS